MCSLVTAFMLLFTGLLAASRSYITVSAPYTTGRPGMSLMQVCLCPWLPKQGNHYVHILHNINCVALVPV